MALFYLQFAFVGPMAPTQFMPQAEAAAKKAAALDETLAEAHVALGAALSRARWDWIGGEREFRRALALDDSDAEAHRMFGALLAATGHSDEALSERLRARELDPVSLQSLLDVAASHRSIGQIDRAAAELRRALDKDPRRPRSHFQLGLTYLQSGMSNEGIRELETAVSLAPANPRFAGYLAYAYAVSGRKTEAREGLDKLHAWTTHQYVSPTVIAHIYAGIGDRAGALVWLEKAVEEHDFELVTSRHDLGLTVLHSDPEYKRILARIGLVR